MLHNLKDLDQYRLIFILYPSGTSGEFLGHALSQCVEGIFSPPTAWEAGSRMKFTDCLGRRLAVERSWPAESDVVSQFNYFLEHYGATKQQHLLSMAHPNDTSIAWIQQHCHTAPVIEITTGLYASQRFRDLAATEKIGPKERDCYRYQRSGAVFAKHLEIEWMQWILTDTLGSFEQICGFLELPGDGQGFQGMVADYRRRNSHLIDIIHANQTPVHSR